jgi:hypothetical protein
MTSKFYLLLQLINIRNVYPCVCPEQGSYGRLRKVLVPTYQSTRHHIRLRPPVKHQTSCHLYNYNSFKPPTYIYPGLQCTVLPILLVGSIYGRQILCVI